MQDHKQKIEVALVEKEALEKEEAASKPKVHPLKRLFKSAAKTEEHTDTAAPVVTHPHHSHSFSFGVAGLKSGYHTLLANAHHSLHNVWHRALGIAHTTHDFAMHYGHVALAFVVAAPHALYHKGLLAMANAGTWLGGLGEQASEAGSALFAAVTFSGAHPHLTETILAAADHLTGGKTITVKVKELVGNLSLPSLSLSHIEEELGSLASPRTPLLANLATPFAFIS